MRYIIGIDLGTTNSCVSFVDTEHPIIQLFRISQLSVGGVVDSRATLPSFCYLATPQEWPQSALDLPWRKESDFFVGYFAQEQGERVPTRLVRSAKSWLCHAGVNRRDKILPAEADAEDPKISPIEATKRYLQHIKEAWDHHFSQNEAFSEQEIVLTVPASFDEVARTLTVEAAKQAGYGNLTLLEEPQAAFYSWISHNEKDWEKKLKAADRILVCDVGGGTTDFSLIHVEEKEGKLSLQRMAVGDHLLLGGDNMDAALAHVIESKLQSAELNTTQWLQLCHQARCAKEVLLSSNQNNEYKIALQRRGSEIVRGSLSATITRQEVEEFLLTGFFGSYSWEEAIQLKKARGLRTMGLPYEDEASITKHLAHFLKINSINQIDYILFNGGAMKAPAFQQAIVDSVRRWFQKEVKVLPSANLDLAVARGAAYYGKVRRGLGVKIGGGAARGYYLSIGEKLLTLLPRGTEEGSVYEPETTFWLTANTPVSFQLHTSHIRLHDKSGDLIDPDLNEMQPLPPIQTVLKFGKQEKQVPVHLKIALTPIGTLEILLKSQETNHQWSLEFQLRSASGQEDQLALLTKRKSDETLDILQIKEAQEVVRTISDNKIMDKLEGILGSSRRDWSLSTLRKLADVVLEQSHLRKRSPEYEARWWNLLGFFLRPGFGYPLDDFRMKEFWKICLADLKTSRSVECQIQKWICYRRLAGGFNRGQQIQLSTEIPLIDTKSGKIEVKGKSDIYPYSEKIRALAAFELVDLPMKIKFGNALINRIISLEGSPAEFWTLGRIGARQLLYGSTLNVVPREICEQWILELLKLKGNEENLLFAIQQLSRKISYRELNISDSVIKKILNRFSHLEALLTHEEEFTQVEQEHIFGDKLPSGLSLRSNTCIK